MGDAIELPLVRQSAIAYAKRGWNVFPLHHPILEKGKLHCSCGRGCDVSQMGKHPTTIHGHKDATDDQQRVAGWWASQPEANIGLATGKASGLVIVDIDPRNGGDLTWEALTLVHGVPETLCVDTGGGGVHLLFAHPGIRIPCRGNALGPGIDIKGDGGYVVAAPSLHGSGKRYKWRSNPNSTTISPLPDWILEIAQAKRSKSKPRPISTRSWLEVAFSHAGGLGRLTENGGTTVICPWAASHSGGQDHDTSTVIFPPKPGDRLGWFHCSHSHCEHRKQADLRAALPAAAVAIADKEVPPLLPDVRAVSKDPHAWQASIMRDKNSAVTPTQANANTILLSAPEWAGCLAFNEFSGKCTWRASPPWFEDEKPEASQVGTAWSDDDLVRCVAWFQRAWHVSMSLQTVSGALSVVAKMHTYHPVREYLESLAWDHVDRLDSWLADFLGTSQSPYHAAVGKRWMIQAVARIYHPGCQADSVLVLEGEQGVGKSTALRTLAGDEWFSDEVSGSLGEKDAALALSGKWLIELAELSSIRRAEREAVKAFLTRRIDHYRPPYGRITIDSPRSCVFAGTTNSWHYLDDESGGRRFWPVRCGEVDCSGLAGARNALWAEAVALYQAGVPWHLTGEESQWQVSEVSERDVIDPWEDQISEWCDGMASDITVRRVLTHCLGIEPNKQGKFEANRVSSLLRRLGFVRVQTTIDGSRVKVWRRR